MEADTIRAVSPGGRAFLSVGFQAGTVDASTCPPKGGRYKDTRLILFAKARDEGCAVDPTSYPACLQQIQTISTNPAHPNVLLIVHSPPGIIYEWLGTQLCWDVGSR
jgi:hypothetical protein